MITFLLLAVCCGTIAYTLSKGSIFASMRMWIIMRNMWLGSLIQCPYCTSHWVAFTAMLVFHPRMINGDFVVTDYLATAFALVGLSAMVAGVFFKLFTQEEPKR